jgi:hypothetical protein
MSIPPFDDIDSGDLFDSDGVLPDDPELHGLSFAEVWQRAVRDIRAHGVAGRDAEVGVCAMAVARRLVTGTIPRLLIVSQVSGVGKTHLMEALAHAIGRPFNVLAGATITPTGWEGINFRTAIRATPDAVICLEDVDAMLVAGDDRSTGNSLERQLALASEFRTLCEGFYTLRRPPTIVATATMPRLRLPHDQSISAEALRAAGMSASIAPLWQPIFLAPLEADLVRSILSFRAEAEAEQVEEATGYAVRWTAMAIRRLHEAALADPIAGLRLGLSLVTRAISAALINGVAIGLPQGSTLVVAPDHLPFTTPPVGPTWRDIERLSGY